MSPLKTRIVPPRPYARRLNNTLYAIQQTAADTQRHGPLNPDDLTTLLGILDDNNGTESQQASFLPQTSNSASLPPVEGHNNDNQQLLISLNTTAYAVVRGTTPKGRDTTLSSPAHRPLTPAQRLAALSAAFASGQWIIDPSGSRPQRTLEAQTVYTSTDEADRIYTSRADTLSQLLKTLSRLYSKELRLPNCVIPATSSGTRVARALVHYSALALLEELLGGLKPPSQLYSLFPYALQNNREGFQRQAAELERIAVERAQRIPLEAPVDTEESRLKRMIGDFAITTYHPAALALALALALTIAMVDYRPQNLDPKSRNIHTRLRHLLPNDTLLLRRHLLDMHLSTSTLNPKGLENLSTSELLRLDPSRILKVIARLLDPRWRGMPPYDMNRFYRETLRHYLPPAPQPHSLSSR